MASYIEECFIDIFLSTIPFNASTTIALVGEGSYDKKRNTLNKELVRRKNKELKINCKLKPKNIEIFTHNKRFKLGDGKHFDILIGCRPCGAEEIILKSATLFKKKFFIMPCLCGNLSEKVPHYIREYPVITHITAGSPDKDRRGLTTWLFLYN